MKTDLLKWAPAKAMKGKTPYESIHRHKMNASYLRMFECVAHVKMTEPHLSKLVDQNPKMVFIRYEGF
jgi:hypothetical protein